MRMITRTFRVNPEYDKVLSQEADKQGLSVSALLNQIIRQYVLITRFHERTPVITLSYQAFAPLLNQIDDKDLTDTAKESGATIPLEALLQRGDKLDYNTIKWFLEVICGRYNNWFSLTHNVVNGNERFHLSHQLNSKWSIYLESYLRSIFKSILDIDPKTETRPNSVTLRLTKSITPVRTT